jgi:ubiquinone/menaquinone biosynthesis C-methylase UbiE
MNNKKTNIIKDFWQKNPVGENLVKAENNWKAHFDKYDKFRYSTEGHILTELDNIDLKNKKILEIGIGQAADSYQIVKRGGIWSGLDLTDAAVERAKERFKINKVTYEEAKKGSATLIPWPDNYFDLVYSHGVLHHIPDINKTQHEISRVLKPNGELVIMLYHKSSLNYWLSIAFIRRCSLLFLIILNNLRIYKPTVDSIFYHHIDNSKKIGFFKYFKMSNFIHANTDGPKNPYSKVYTLSTLCSYFSCFDLFKNKIHFLNERHFPGIKLLPLKFRLYLASKFGWHLWGFLKNNKK